MCFFLYVLMHAPPTEHTCTFVKKGIFHDSNCIKKKKNVTQGRFILYPPHPVDEIFRRSSKVIFKGVAPSAFFDLANNFEGFRGKVGLFF